MSAAQRDGTVYAKMINKAIGEAIDNRDWRTVWEMADELSAIAPRLMTMACDGAPPQRSRATGGAEEAAVKLGKFCPEFAPVSKGKARRSK